MASACDVSQEIFNFVSSDTNRIQGQIIPSVARRSPYVNVLEGGTLENNFSETVRAVVQEKPFIGHSLTRPAFTQATEMCGVTGEQMKPGTTEYTETLSTLRGEGPPVCIKLMRNAFKNSYVQTEMSLKKRLIDINNADVRAVLVDRSGLKLTVNAAENTATGFDAIFNGHEQAIDTDFVPDLLPDTAPTFKTIKYVSQIMREDFGVEVFEDEEGGHLKLITSPQMIDIFREEIGIRDDYRHVTAGGFKVGKDTLLGYTWRGPYQGIAFGTDSQPLRYNVVDEDGQPDYIEPEIAVPVTNGYAGRVSSAWFRARYEIMLLIGKGSFRRRVPERYTGEGSFRFPGQIAQGSLEFVVIRDNTCNKYGDYGSHLYEIERSYRPERPHAICAIAFKRCAYDLGLEPCTLAYPDYSSTDSI